MNDRPDATELLEAVRRFIETEVMPNCKGPRKYQARVAANVLEIVRREWECEPRHLRDEWTSAGLLLGIEEPFPSSRQALRESIRERTDGLVARIRSGEADSGPFRSAVLAHLRSTCAAKLEVSRGEAPGR